MFNDLTMVEEHQARHQGLPSWADCRPKAWVVGNWNCEKPVFFTRNPLAHQHLLWLNVGQQITIRPRITHNFESQKRVNGQLSSMGVSPTADSHPFPLGFAVDFELPTWHPVAVPLVGTRAHPWPSHQDPAQGGISVSQDAHGHLIDLITQTCLHVQISYLNQYNPIQDFHRCTHYRYIQKDMYIVCHITNQFEDIANISTWWSLCLRRRWGSQPC